MMLMMTMIMMTILMMMKQTNKMMNKNKKNSNNKSKIECGFSTMINQKTNLSMKSFTIMMTFIMFDMEMIIMMPSMMNKKNPTNQMITNLMFIFIMSTMMMEMKNNKIKWIQ